MRRGVVKKECDRRTRYHIAQVFFFFGCVYLCGIAASQAVAIRVCRYGVCMHSRVENERRAAVTCTCFLFVPSILIWKSPVSDAASVWS